jgi:Transposase DDE domain
MLLGQIFDRFVQASPLSVMTRGLLENILQPGLIDELFARTAETQYTKELLFSTVVDTMSLVVCGFYQSPRAVYIDRRDLFPVTLKCFYEKLHGIELPVMRQLVRDTAGRLESLVKELGGALPALLPDYPVKVLDGNCLAGSEHRIKELRANAAAALPGKSLVVLDPTLGLVVDVFPCEDGHAQERSLLAAVMDTVRSGELWIEDRNFCTLGFLFGVARRQAFFLVREHQNLPWRAVDELRRVGRTETGEVWEQTVEAEDDSGTVLRLRRVVLKLDKPTRDGDTEVALLSNLWDARVGALTLARLYLKRWTIETAFQVLTETLDCEQPRLGYPKAALFAFCVTLVAYNVLAVVKAALRAAHGSNKVEQEVSLYHVTEQVRRTYTGMMIALPAEEWVIFQGMRVCDLAQTLRELASQVRLSTIPKAPSKPKKPRPERMYDPKVPHVSTAKVLGQRRQQ